MVVIALGADGSVTHDDVGQTLGLLCCTRLLVLVTPRELGGGFGSDAITERVEAHRHHGRILLLDWGQVQRRARRLVPARRAAPDDPRGARVHEAARPRAALRLSAQAQAPASERGS